MSYSQAINAPQVHKKTAGPFDAWQKLFTIAVS
jgi:hypothetical protein